MTLPAAGKIVIRLDDACPTMAAGPWRAIEDILLANGIRPIVGVIPECRDTALQLDAPDPEFWPRVRTWQDRGWAIALHGEHHLYQPITGGAKSLVPFHSLGEYVGRPLEDQRASIAKSWSRFRDEGVQPSFFMAPLHSFDATTLEALKAETGISWITDGISWRPFRRQGFNWLPQQLFRLRQPPPAGVWTVCLHPNTMRAAEIEAFGSRLSQLKPFVISPLEVCVSRPTEHGAADRAFEYAYWRLARLKWFWDGKTAPER